MADYYPLVIAAGLVQEVPSGSYVNIAAIDQSDIDHGSISGLADDDHTSYHTDGRAATWLAANHETTYNHANFVSVASLTATRVPYASAAHTIVDSANMTFDGTTLTITKAAINTSGQSQVFSTRYGANSVGFNIWIGGGGESSVGVLGDTDKGSRNISVGYNALLASTTGYLNIALGSNALVANTSGSFNVAIGASAMVTNTTGSNNMAQGTYTLFANTIGGNNTAVGFAALQACTEGNFNTGIGASVLGAMTTGEFNTCIGTSAGQAITTGSNNTAIGRTALGSITTASGCVALGWYAGVFETGSDKLFIDNATRASEADARVKAMVYGVFAATAVAQDFTVNAQIGVNIVPAAWLTLPAGTTTAGTAPLKFTSGTSLTTAEAGAIEFTTDDVYFTITTGAARKGFVLNDGANLTSGKIPIATTNGRLIDGQTPLTGTKVYYVADSSGGAVTRKLTFIDGILTSET